MANDALACFSSLLKNVPTWIMDLEDVLQGTTARQEEMLFTHMPEEPTTGTARRRATSKSSSLRSRPSRGPRVQQDAVNPLADPDALRLSQRKRKTASACSGDLSGPVKSRTRAAAVVYYDGQTQGQLERIVRTVGSSRNTIRKAKMSAKVESLNRPSSSCSDMSSNSDDEIQEGDFSPAKFRLHVKPSRTPRSSSRRNETECFDKVDGLLEKAQSAIERAAHQVLREGDCAPEVRNAKDYFTQALRLAEAEVPVFQRRFDKAVERRQRSEERRRAEEEAEECRRSASQLHQKIVHAVAPAFPAGSRLDVDALEVDDESDDSVGEFNVTAIRGNFGSLAQMKCSRLTAR